MRYKKIIQAYESVALMAQDWDVLMDAMNNPQPPNERLRKAFALHKQYVRQEWAVVGNNKDSLTT